ncbi:hypothetical protein ACIQHY_26115 [Streptomyces sp. NPDC092359]|uniref:hypothetical protein n=1 Tax=Streptomyces sp. NPDC092359 TaxID=3366014 RepID=UPI00381A110D
MTDEPRLRRELREAALAHRPDHARILARVERGLAVSASRRSRNPSGLRRTGVLVAVTVAAVVGIGGAVGIGGLAATGPTAPQPGPAAVPPVPSTGPGARATGTVDAGGNRWWAQSDLALTTDAPAEGVLVELLIARTPGVVSTGHWRTRPAEDFTETVTEETGHLVYRWILKPGRTVPPGSHVFAGQYNHAEGVRDFRADSYTVVLTGTDGGRSTLRGGFRTAAAR